MIFVQSQLSDKETTITEHENKLKEKSSESTKLLEKLEHTQKLNEEIE